MSEAKLKALKVVDLKAILQQAGVPIGSKANKPDLIAKILKHPAALAVYHDLHPSPSPKPSQKQQSPPPRSASPTPEIDELVDSPEPPEYDDNPPAPNPASDSQSAPVPPPVSDTSETISTTAGDASPSATQIKPSDSADEELEKRKARAARFAIPLVEPVQPKATKQPAKHVKIAQAAISQPVPDDADRLRARASRFGLPDPTAAAVKPTAAAIPAAEKTAKVNGRKRAAPPSEIVDAEELERRRKRAERFGLNNVGMAKV